MLRVLQHCMCTYRLPLLRCNPRTIRPHQFAGASGPPLWSLQRSAFVVAAARGKPHIDVAEARKKAEGRGQAAARAFRPVPQLVLTVSKGASRAADSLADELADKVRRYAPVEMRELRANPKRTAAIDVVIASEGDKVLQALQPQDRVVVLDERGRAVVSEDVAALLAEAGDQSAGRVVWCIGGPFGHSQAVVDRADDVIRLSNLVLNHQVANIVLLEQIYRGFTILRGEKYHH